MHTGQGVAVPAHVKSLRNDPRLVAAGALKRFRIMMHIEMEAGHPDEAALYARRAASKTFFLCPELRVPDLAIKRKLQLQELQLPFPEAV
jgi:hypothetical protein